MSSRIVHKRGMTVLTEEVIGMPVITHRFQASLNKREKSIFEIWHLRILPIKLQSLTSNIASPQKAHFGAKIER